MKKFPGKLLSFRLLYVKSKTSNTGKAPKPRGRELSLFILQKKLVGSLIGMFNFVKTVKITPGSKYEVLALKTKRLVVLQFDY